MTLMLAGRAMTLAFIGRVGQSGVGDPPAAWLMPLAGDAVIGCTALVAAFLIWKGRGLAPWTLLIVWNALAIWDALSAFLVHLSVPWPSFFMVEIFGATMFFAASAMHAVCIALLVQADVRERYFGVTISSGNAHPRHAAS